jgi:NADPH-dependent glutamate synthase beta subunit-like oxidoreductase
MDRERLLQLEAQCIQNEPAACDAACPVHVAARAMLAAAARGDWTAARDELTRAVPFPHVISRCCDAPCEVACVRADAGGAIRIRDLERAAMEYGEAASAPPAVMRPHKAAGVAIVGAGMSGLSAAYELACRGYSVTVFEAEDALGGRARRAAADGRLSAGELAADLAPVTAAGARFVPFTTVALAAPRGANALAGLAPDVDAIYLAVGAAEADAGAELGYEVDENGRIAVDPVTLETSRPGVYAGGGMLRPDEPWSPVASIADGRRAALSIDRQLQRVSLSASREDRGAFVTGLVVNLAGVEDVPPAAPAEPARGFTLTEAADEAGRCLQCACLECIKVCPYLEAYGAYPGAYARRVYNNLAVTQGRGTRSANKMIDSCSLCRLCYEVCPTDLDFAQVARDARHEMVRQERMPASAFSFALEDLRLATAHRSALARHAPGTTASEAVFFPGCQLAASDPGHVERAYAYLRERYEPAIGLLLYCCGAPADWAGREDLFEETLAGLRARLEGLGSPRVVLACPTCETVFAAHLPDVETVSLWEVFRDAGLPDGAASSGGGRRLAMHDACTARYQPEVQGAVRDIVGACGYEVDELALSRKRTTCCGFGGLMLFADPAMGDTVVDRRLDESDADLLAYCAMCRDRFAAKGRPALHVLDLLFAGDYAARSARRGPVLTQRSEQRALLKERLVAGVWGEGAVPGAGWRDALLVAPEVEDLLERRFLRPEEVHQVVLNGEASGRRFVEQGTARSLASLAIGAVTYWVEYSREGARFRVHSAYSHRMEHKPPPWPPADALEQPDGRTWLCALGDHPLEPRIVTLSYLVAGFPVKLPACLQHEHVLISEDIAMRRMRGVELALEDK